MLSILAKNPVFASNPACLADFVRTLIQPPASSIPTPIQKPAVEMSSTAQPSNAPPPAEPAPKASPVTQPAAGVGGADDSGDNSEAAVAARKQFWQKFKRLRPADPLPSPNVGNYSPPHLQARLRLTLTL